MLMIFIVARELPSNYTNPNTFSALSVPPSKATGESMVGGRPARGPVGAMRVLQLRRQLKRDCREDDSTRRVDSGRLSMDC